MKPMVCVGLLGFVAVKPPDRDVTVGLIARLNETVEVLVGMLKVTPPLEPG